MSCKKRVMHTPETRVIQDLALNSARVIPCSDLYHQRFAKGAASSSKAFQKALPARIVCRVSPCQLAVSPIKLQPKLNFTSVIRRIAGSSDFSECGGTQKVREGRQGKICRVRKVKDLRPKLEMCRLGRPELLEY